MKGLRLTHKTDVKQIQYNSHPLARNMSQTSDIYGYLKLIQRYLLGHD